MFSHTPPFVTQGTNWKEKPVSLESFCLWRVHEKVPQGLGLKEADFTLLGYTCSWLLSYGMLETQTWRPRSGKKKYGSLNWYVLYKSTSVSKNCPTLLFTGSLQTFNLQQQSSVKLSDPAYTGSVTSSKTVTQASSKQVLGGQQLFALWTGSLGIISS